MILVSASDVAKYAYCPASLFQNNNRSRGSGIGEIIHHYNATGELDLKRFNNLPEDSRAKIAKSIIALKNRKNRLESLGESVLMSEKDILHPELGLIGRPDSVYTYARNSIFIVEDIKSYSKPSGDELFRDELQISAYILIQSNQFNDRRRPTVMGRSFYVSSNQEHNVELDDYYKDKIISTVQEIRELYENPRTLEFENCRGEGCHYYRKCPMRLNGGINPDLRFLERRTRLSNKRLF